MCPGFIDIQELLGHAKLETTQIYTKVSIEKLKQIQEELGTEELGADLKP